MNIIKTFLFIPACFLALPVYSEGFLLDIPIACTKQVDNVSKAVASHGEKAFAKGKSDRLINNDTSYSNSFVLFVNPDTKSWTFVEITKENIFCVIAAGEDFQPAKLRSNYK